MPSLQTRRWQSLAAAFAIDAREACGAGRPRPRPSSRSRRWRAPSRPARTCRRTCAGWPGRRRSAGRTGAGAWRARPSAPAGSGRRRRTRARRRPWRARARGRARARSRRACRARARARRARSSKRRWASGRLASSATTRCAFDGAAAEPRTGRRRRPRRRARPPRSRPRVAVEHVRALALEDPGARRRVARAATLRASCSRGATVIDRERAASARRPPPAAAKRSALRGAPASRTSGRNCVTVARNGPGAMKRPCCSTTRPSGWKPSPRPPSSSGTSIAVQPSSRALFQGCSGALPFSTTSRTSAVGHSLLRARPGPSRPAACCFRRDLEIHLRVPGSAGPRPRAAMPSMRARHEQDLALVLARARPGSRDRTGTSSVSQGMAAKWNTVIAPIRLMKRWGSISGLSSPDATPSSITARNHSTERAARAHERRHDSRAARSRPRAGSGARRVGRCAT